MGEQEPARDVEGVAAEARVSTARAARYLIQLCSHLAQIEHLGARVETSDRTGLVDLGWARAEVVADEDALTLRVRAADPRQAEFLQQRLGDMLARIGRRDGLSVEWRDVSGAV